ncbi:class I SAM-dependent methyltransferase [Pseudoalteromonas sp. SMS1]|uniref:class I SAM-dependent methyltransferase n=1 Tax=Pseudoalteromonas sp. SMS1 TaxID=2908894 RepID=UPI001F3D4976|nr:class I SAM-dependent methyltransferase [Pseudoalteromonas sp. SMS1]MCF2859372.1 class I SAM-dependent methyltransferase [Pseudoalteromonas sp. SMS1]
MSPEELKNYYQSLFRLHGESAAAVQHVSKDAQYVRFEIFCEFIDTSDSIIDLGCGLGDMLVYLRNHDHTGNYLGCDFVPEFIKNAQTKFENDESATFQVMDIIKDEIPKEYDYIVMSGIFNNVLNCNESFLRNTIEAAFKAANKGVIFNALSTFVEYQESSLFYVNPLETFEYIKRHITPYVTLKHDYVTKPDGFPYEFTMVMRKEGVLV